MFVSVDFVVNISGFDVDVVISIFDIGVVSACIGFAVVVSNVTNDVENLLMWQFSPSHCKNNFISLWTKKDHETDIG